MEDDRIEHITQDIPLNEIGSIEVGQPDSSYRQMSIDAGFVPKEEEPADAVQEEPTTEEVSEEAPQEEVVAEEPIDDDRRVLTDDELDNTFVVTKVNGVEEMVSLREARDNFQIREAGLERLSDAKSMQKQYHELISQYQRALEEVRQPTPVAPTYEDDYSTPEDRQLAEMRQELQAMKQQITQAETQRLSSVEDDIIRARIRDHFGKEDLQAATQLIARVKAEDPAYGAIADQLFTGTPTSQEHLNQRVAFMDSLLIKAKSLEMPTIIEKAKEEGKNELKREKKSKLASVETTQKPPDVPRSEKVRQAARGGDRALAESLRLEVFKNQFPEFNTE